MSLADCLPWIIWSGLSISRWWYRKEGAMSEDVANETHFPLKTAALRVFDLPLSWYNSLIQVMIAFVVLYSSVWNASECFLLCVFIFLKYNVYMRRSIMLLVCIIIAWKICSNAILLRTTPSFPCIPLGFYYYNNCWISGTNKTEGFFWFLSIDSVVLISYRFSVDYDLIDTLIWNSWKLTYLLWFVKLGIYTLQVFFFREG